MAGAIFSMNLWPVELIERLMSVLSPRCLTVIMMLDMKMYTIVNDYIHRIAESFLSKSVYSEYIRQQMLPDIPAEVSADLYVMFIVQCVGCGCVPNKDGLQLIHDGDIYGVACSSCTQLVSVREAASQFLLDSNDIEFLIAERSLKLIMTPRGKYLRLKDIHQLLSHKDGLSPKEWQKWRTDTAQARRDMILNRARQLGVDEIALSGLKRRTRIYYGPDWHFFGRNLDHLILAHGGIYYKELIEVQVYYHYYQQTQDEHYMTRLLMSYNSLYQKLLAEENNLSIVGEQVFLPRYRDSMKRCIAVLEQAGMCPVRSRLIETVENWPEFLE